MAPRAGSLVRSRVFGNLHEEEEILFAKFVLSAACQHQRNPLSICYTTYLPQEHRRPGTSNSLQCLLEQPSYRMHFTCAVCRELHSGYFQSRDGLPPTPASQHDLSAPPAHLKRRPLGPDHAIIQRAAEVSSRTPCSMSPPSLLHEKRPATAEPAGARHTLRRACVRANRQRIHLSRPAQTRRPLLLFFVAGLQTSIHLSLFNLFALLATKELASCFLSIILEDSSQPSYTQQHCLYHCI